VRSIYEESFTVIAFRLGKYKALSFWILDLRFGITDGRIQNPKSKISMRLGHCLLRVTVIFVIVLFVWHRLRQIDH
jgi:hypothetical protein